MIHSEQWIWLPKEKYPNHQTTIFHAHDPKAKGNFTVAEFTKRYDLPKVPKKVDIRVSADTLFQLFCNETCVATGPASVGGDFFGNERPRENYYAFETAIYPDKCELEFFARVQMTPDRICDYSRGHGGFMLSAIATFDDGTQMHFETDSSWLARKNGAYTASRIFDGTVAPDEFVNAEITENIWHTTTAPIPVREEKEIFADGYKIALAPYEEKEVALEFDKIYAGFLHVKAKTKGNIHLHVRTCEIPESVVNREKFIVSEDTDYRGFYTHSIGQMNISLKNESDAESTVEVSLISTNYPITEEATTTTSDEDMNLVLDVCKHTLKICRQTHHLDSPGHCEPLACTGDYYIESLMTMFSFGDMRLAEFDLLRTAVMLERENGRMFHTTYSLIFVRMLYDTYMATGNIELLRKCEKALRLLLARFETYIGENGLIETPPDYMFIDWIYIDEISMHHPPKALGQTCLNIYYFAALEAAEKIFGFLSLPADADGCRTKKEALRSAVNTQLFDAEKGVYFEGLNTPTEERLLGKWMPQNTEKRYYLKHSNILAACFGICDDDTSTRLIHEVMSDKIEGDCQPYFLHFLFEAIFRLGLREQYTAALAKRWIAPVKECPKGLVEGFIMPEPTYRFDHSHAWGGTPLYSLPKALLGLEVIEPGMREIKLSPSLLDFENATVELLTPCGKLTCKMQKGQNPEITVPNGIKLKK